MALTLPQSDSIQVGNQAIAQVAISEMTSACLTLGIVLTKLFEVENLFNLTATKMVEKNTREAAEKQALSTLLRGIGTGVMGLFTMGSSFASPISESLNSKGLAADEAELNTMKEYRDAVKGPSKDVERGVTIIDDEQSLGEMQKKRMERLSRQQDFKEEDLSKVRALDDRELSDEGLFELSKNADSEEAEKLGDHLDMLIKKKEASISNQRDMAYRKGENIGRALQGIGQISDGALQGGSAGPSEQAGKNEAAKAVAQATQGMATS